jgi:outer membrane receptor protein involved in Fe transport
LVAAISLLTQAQTPHGEIRLEVMDPSRAGVAATGILHMPSGPAVPFTTDAHGVFRAADLKFGSYRIEVAKAGFVPQSLTISVQSPEPVVRTVILRLAPGPAVTVDIVATTPLAGTELTASQIAVPTQTASQTDIAQSGSLDLEDFLNRRFSGVYLNEMQGNPFQPDLNFRGYTASPLLGTPQGISVYLDGVRQNQPFGDVVSWDLIPQNAVSSVTLMPGSDPLFGLNTLGGALSVQTKDGAANPGLIGKLTYGSSGRKALQAEYGGGQAAGFNWFLAANIFHESGWRFDSPSDVRQGFARIGWRNARTDLSLVTTYAYNTLSGNGLQDYRLLANNYASVYTIPDQTSDRSPSVNFLARHTLSNTLTLSGNAYFRNIRTEGINGNLNTNSLDQAVYQPSAADQAALKAAGYTGYPTSGATAANTPFPKWRCIAQALELSDPSARCDGLIVYSKSVQNDYGFAGQLTWLTAPSIGHNQLTAGAAYDRGSVSFTQNAQFGYINPDYTITGVRAWADGSTSDSGMPVDSRVNLHGLTPNWSLYATDTFRFGKEWNLTLSGRFNRSSIRNSDRINPGGGPGSLDGNYTFQRINPAVGLTYNPISYLNFYASFTQGSRAPTSIELGCADPNNPCNLPNALASDPPLKQVVTTTWEAGLRGALERNLSWTLGAFRGQNDNDILFVASQQTGSGYFQNFAKTRREGVQANLDGHFHKVDAGLDYTFLSATYQSVEALEGTANNASDIALSGYPGLGGVITVHPGNRIPLVPKSSGKAFMDYRVTSKLTADLNVIANSSAYARGNENNVYRPDGKYYLGPGYSAGYAVVNLAAHYRLSRRLELRGQLDNLFNRHYDTAAQLANTGFTSQGTFIAREFPAYGAGPQQGNYPLQSSTFFAPGAPRRAWAELRVIF